VEKNITVGSLRELCEKYDDDQEIQLNIEDRFNVTCTMNLFQDGCYQDLVLVTTLEDGKYITNEDEDNE